MALHIPLHYHSYTRNDKMIERTLQNRPKVLNNLEQMVASVQEAMR